MLRPNRHCDGLVWLLRVGSAAAKATWRLFLRRIYLWVPNSADRGVDLASAGPYEMFAAAMLAVIPCAILSWHFVELPAQIVGKKTAHLFAGKLQPNRTALSVIRWNWLGVALPVLITVVAILGFGVSTLRLNSIDAVALDTEIAAFGPTPIVHGQPFNQQPNGESAIWVKLDRPAAQDFVLVLAGERLATIVRGDLLTAAVPPKLFSSRGSLPLWVEAVRNARKAKSKPVSFDVQ